MSESKIQSFWECPRWKIESPFNHPSMVFHFAVDSKLDLIGRRMYYLSSNDAHLQYIRIYPRQVYCNKRLLA